MLQFEFTNPSAAELELRRHSLNKAGYLAYALPVVLLFSIFISRVVINSSSSPFYNILKPKPDNDAKLLSSVKKRLRCVLWDLAETHIPEYGPLYVQCLGFFYVVILLYIIVSPTLGQQNDYLHLTKAFGHVAVSQLPTLYLLSVKTPSSPIQIATGLTHERLNAVHRLFGQIVHALFVCHASLYLNFFVAKGLLLKRLENLDVQTGLSAFGMLNILVVMALPVVRRKWYHAGFYQTHVFVSAAVLVFIWFHVPYTRIYVAQAALIWIWSGISRRGHKSFGWSGAVSVNCTNIGDGLVKVTARLSDPVTGRRWSEEWVPGMHAYLNQGIFGPKAPFTVVNVETTGDKTSIQMIVRNLGGPATDLLARAAKAEKELNLSLEGPYGEAREYMPNLLDAGAAREKVLVVAGGVGATYSLPIYLALLKAREGNREDLKFIWFVKQKSDAQWGIELLQPFQTSLNIAVIATRAGPAKYIFEDKTWQNLRDNAPVWGKGRGGMVLTFDLLITGFLRKTSDRCSVLVCGPPGQSRFLRATVGRHLLYNDKHIDWYEEQFGFGGN